MNGNKKRSNRIPGAMFIRGVPKDLRNAFRAWCLMRGTTIQDKIAQLMRDTIKNSEEKK